MAGHARSRARQHRRGDARRAGGRRGAGGDAARGGRGLVLVARRAPGRGHRADHRGRQDTRRGDRRGPGHGVRAGRAVRERPGGATSTMRRSGSTRRTGSAGASRTAAPGCWRWSARWNTCWGRPTRTSRRSNRCSTDEDPWVRALARLHMGKMRVMLGQGGRDADAYLEAALTEFQTLGERFGISFALTELADRIAVRGEFAGACESLRAGDRGRHRGRCHRGRHPDAVAAGAAVLAAGRRGRRRGRHRRGAAVRRAGHLAGRAGRAGPREGGTRPVERRTPRRHANSSASRWPCWATRRRTRTTAP